ncbi:CsgG/HfaB family protein [Alloalcanivorax sp. C16-2]|uniref:CsgG/HfaB family protein n=1 Tax=Alloalcanivorax TaxID=3020832 RepID=UPI0019322DFD|nr:CsgG/HfaB family protein [Alloalcanivorax marinus]MBL7251133.1 penicillin-binding protein activator LpoB [Alloalcanivorax marinus]
MLKRLSTLFVLLALVATGLVRAADTETVTARGYGEDPEQAVTNALVAAVRQAGGVTLAVDPSFRRQVSQWVIQRQGDVTTWTGTRTSVAEPQLPTLGSLESYRVTGVAQEDNALWRADVEAVILRHRAPGPDRSHLPAIVVAPFTSDADRYTLGETSLPAAEVGARLQANLVDAFTQSGRFRVLDRAHLAERDAERAILRNGSAEPAELLRLGKAKGADLLLVGHIEAFDIGDQARTFYGASFQGYEPYVRVRYRLIDAAGGEILAAGLFDWQQSEGSVRQLARRQNLDDWRHPERLADLVYPRIARDLAGAATDTLYPVIVLKADGDRVYLSQGQGRLEADTVLNVHRPVETLKDPQTGLPIRMESDALASLRVTEVRPDYAVARITQRREAPQPGDRVRPPAPSATPAEAPAGQPDSPGSSELPLSWD